MGLAIKMSMTNIYCSLIGHQYKVQKHVTEHIKEYKCTCCGHEVTTNANGGLVPLTQKLKEVHVSLEQVISKRRNKTIQQPNFS